MNDGSLPETIKYPDNFNNSQWHIVCPCCGEEIGFDGVFPWGWIIDAIKAINPESKIMPMDFDAVVERNKNFLVFETKDEDKAIPQGQKITLDALKNPKSFTVVKIWGKTNPFKMEINYPGGKIKTTYDFEEMFNHIKNWYKWANNGG